MKHNWQKGILFCLFTSSLWTSGHNLEQYINRSRTFLKEMQMVALFFYFKIMQEATDLCFAVFVDIYNSQSVVVFRMKLNT